MLLQNLQANSFLISKYGLINDVQVALLLTESFWVKIHSFQNCVKVHYSFSSFPNFDNWPSWFEIISNQIWDVWYFEVEGKILTNDIDISSSWHVWTLILMCVIDDRKSDKIMIQYLFIGSRSQLVETWFRCSSLSKQTLYHIIKGYFPPNINA